MVPLKMPEHDFEKIRQIASADAVPRAHAQQHAERQATERSREERDAGGQRRRRQRGCGRAGVVAAGASVGMAVADTVCPGRLSSASGPCGDLQCRAFPWARSRGSGEGGARALLHLMSMEFLDPPLPSLRERRCRHLGRSGAPYGLRLGAHQAAYMGADWPGYWLGWRTLSARNPHLFWLTCQHIPGLLRSDSGFSGAENTMEGSSFSQKRSKGNFIS